MYSLIVDSKVKLEEESEKYILTNPTATYTQMRNGPCRILFKNFRKEGLKPKTNPVISLLNIRYSCTDIFQVYCLIFSNFRFNFFF